MPSISERKSDHLDLCISGDVGFAHKSTLLECVELIHCSLPELAFDEIDLSVRWLGKRLRAPLLIAGMTGGNSRAQQINRDLARLAEEQGYAFGLGSQRPMLLSAAAQASYEVRDVAPNTVLLGNIGAVQAVQTPLEQLERLVRAVGADALCVHLNPAQELVQEHGDRDFRGCLAALGRLQRELSVPVIAKETGAGVSYAVGRALRAAGVQYVDISGAGGTSWTAVEMQRAQGAARSLGEALREWGIPTAASLGAVQDLDFTTVIASGGVTRGLDAARALALGAGVVGIARPVLQAYDAGGVDGAREYLKRVELELRSVMLLVGAGSVRALPRVPRMVAPPLAAWFASWQAERLARSKDGGVA